MNWVNDFLRKKGEQEEIGKDKIKNELREFARSLLRRGYDWRDVELFCIVGLSDVVGGYMILVLKWLKEIKDEETEVTAN